MKCFWFIFLSFLLSARCASQQGTQPEARGFAPFFLGDSIARFGPLLTCMEYPYLDKPYPNSTTCRIYRFGSAQIDSFPVGPVTFFGVMLSNDSQKRINMILYTRSYPKEGAGLPGDFAVLKAHFTRLFGAEGRKKAYPKSKYDFLTGLIWTTGRYSLTLEGMISNRKHNGKKFSLLSLTVLDDHKTDETISDSLK